VTHGDMRLKDRVAVVTGAGRGIGRGIAAEFAREGARVVIAEVDEASARDVQAHLAAAGGTARAIPCDVAKEDDIRRLMTETEEAFGGLDMLVNNAAVGVYKSLTEATAEDFDRAVAVNLRGVFLCMKHATPLLRRSGSGSIINIASVHSVQNVGGTVPYAASKGGVAALTRAAAIDLAADGIRVNAICPGWIDTPLIRGIFDETEDPAAMRAAVEKRQLLGRLGTPEEIGRAAVFLASDDSTYVTGSLLFVDAGMTAQLESWS
jgi:NAD(P)-dependent dehydrogenase (short-subunit alcohol dehydrogenase family)